MGGIGRWLFGGAIGILLTMIGWDRYVALQSSQYLYTSVAATPHYVYGMVLGTSPKISAEQANPFYLARVLAAARLYHAGKVQYLILSGHEDAYYSEPTSLKQDLIQAGVPPKALLIDAEGDRTWQSIQHLCNRSGIDSLLIISQQFHNERAVFMARWHGIKAAGFNATEVRGWRGMKVRIRETFARVRMAWDMLYAFFVGHPKRCDISYGRRN